MVSADSIIITSALCLRPKRERGVYVEEDVTHNEETKEEKGRVRMETRTRWGDAHVSITDSFRSRSTVHSAAAMPRAIAIERAREGESACAQHTHTHTHTQEKGAQAGGEAGWYREERQSAEHTRTCLERSQRSSSDGQCR